MTGSPSTFAARVAALAAILLQSWPLAASLTAQGSRVRDSAGVRIVENPARSKAPVVFQLGATPLLDVGGIEGNPDQEFNHNQGYLRGVRLAQGGLAVIDVVRVHYFTGQSKRVRIVGREGRGPEEFLYLVSMCRTRGDTLVVSDSRNRRLGVLDSAGAIVRTIAQADLGSPPFDFCFNDGTFVLQRLLGEPGTGARQKRLTRMRTDGSTVNVIGEFTDAGFDMVTQRSAAFVAAGQRFYYGSGEQSQVQIYSPTGKLLSIVRSDDPPIRITDADVERRLSGTIPNNVSPAERSERLAQLRAAPHAATWPAYRGILVDPDGRMWIQDYQVSYPAPDGWTAFDESGRLLGRLVIPAPPPREPRTEIISFGANEVLVRRRDSDGGAHLTLYPLIGMDRRVPEELAHPALLAAPFHSTFRRTSNR